MRALYVVSVWLHIVAAALWVGGMLFLVLVLMPALRKEERPERVAALVQAVGRRFRTVGWGALLLLLVTGAANVGLRGIGWAELAGPAFWEGTFGRVLAVKLALVGLTLALSLVHDVVLGPRATAASRAQGAGGVREGGAGGRDLGQEEGRRDELERARRLRRQATWIGRLNLLIALVIVALGVMLVRGTP